MNNNNIDFVMLWVDGNDKEWQRVKDSYSGEKGDRSPNRYRDWDNLQYWFRGVEQFAPWVNRIFFVTCGHLPKWLNTSHPKLTVVRHEDYIDPRYLPTFCPHPLELNLHRIKGLSEHFVYFNDDIFLINPVKPDDFFRNGLPRDRCIETAVTQNDIRDPFAHVLLNNVAIINHHFKKREVIRHTWRKFFSPVYGPSVLRNVLMLPYKEFSGFKFAHLASPFLKSTFDEVWRAEGDYLDLVCQNRFRTTLDVNQYLFKEWQRMKGDYVPQASSFGKYFQMGRDDAACYETLKKHSVKMVCINDGKWIQNFQETKQKVNGCLQSLLPEKSGYEI